MHAFLGCGVVDTLRNRGVAMYFFFRTIEKVQLAQHQYFVRVTRAREGRERGGGKEV